jgi:hypothetical protein
MRPPVLTLALSAAFCVAVLLAAPRPLLPVDQAATRPDFFSFRARLQQAIANRDAPAVLGIVDRHIKNSFGDDNGIDAFREMWKPHQPDSELWNELGTVLSLGGRFPSAETFVAPYVFSEWPDDVDAFEHVAVIGTDVRVRAAADSAGPVLGSVSYAILPVPRIDAPAEGWRPVTFEGRTGYVSAAFTRYAIDYRAIFSSASGQWRLVTFVAGD